MNRRIRSLLSVGIGIGTYMLARKRRNGTMGNMFSNRMIRRFGRKISKTFS